MSRNAKFIGCGLLALITLATWRFVSPPAEESWVGKSEVASEPVKAVPLPANTSGAAAASNSVSPADAVSPQGKLDGKPAERLDDAHVLTEQTLIGTKWQRDGFGFEFGSAARLIIGGRERAKWHVEGQRVRLYSDTTGEEHWLDIVGNRLMWNGQEIGRVP